MDSHRETQAFAGCNAGLFYELKLSRELLFGGSGTTHIPCDEPHATLDERYFEALSQVTDVSVVDNRMLMTGPEVELLYDRSS